jgi:ATP-binding cassette, subfamily A (ABC1), member 3
VQREEANVRAASSDEYMVKAVNLCKQYPKGPCAIRGNTFGIKKNEVLGLLGPNGAGKSTTFSILTMEITRSDGEAYILGNEVLRIDNQKQGNRMGLCAQNNLIWDKLTVDEHLNMIGRIKGLSAEDINFQRELIKQTLDLTQFANK